MSNFILQYKNSCLLYIKAFKTLTLYHWTFQVSRAPISALLPREPSLSLTHKKDTSRIRSSSISLKTVPLIWFGFRATQLKTGILNFVLIGFFIFTATEVREVEIKTSPKPHDPQGQSGNSPCRWHFNTGGTQARGAQVFISTENTTPGFGLEQFEGIIWLTDATWW